MTHKKLREILEQHKLWLIDGLNGTRADLSGANLNGANLNGANLNGANLSRAYLNEANLSGANLSRADLSGAYLSEADLGGANLSRANLSRAYLGRAYLNGAGLNRANLSEADLGGADLSGCKGTMTFMYNQHLAVFQGTHILIGCEYYSVDEWIKIYKKLGGENGYSKDEIKEYRRFIKMCKKGL